MASRPQQRSNLRPENVDDNDHGQDGDRGAVDRSDNDDIDNDLTDEERAQLEGMRTGAGDREPDGGADREGADDGQDDGGDGDGEQDDADGVGDDGAADRTERQDRDQNSRDGRGQQDDQSQQRQKPKTINYGRHQREITKREQRVTELEGLLATEREQRTRLDERTRLLLEAVNSRGQQQDQGQQQQQEPQDPEPDKDADPIGHLEWRNRQL